MTIARVHSKLGGGQHVERSQELAFPIFPAFLFVEEPLAP